MAQRTEGTPAYLAAHSASAVFHHPDRGFLSIEGSAPGDMLKGILSGRIPPPPGKVGEAVLVGEAPYSTILTPKGKMVTDLRVIPEPSGGFLLELPESSRAGTLAHFKKYLHPRFARVEDRSSAWSRLTLVGPKARDILEPVLGVEGTFLARDHLRYHETPGFPGFWMVGNGDLGLPAVDIILPSSEAEALHASFMGTGMISLDETSWETLRIEAGTPRFGREMTEDTIPLEVGIQARAIDNEKGCYTGQEVIVRIRDRGQVNKRLCRVFLGDAPVPTGGEELFGMEQGKVVGWVTSACVSPRFGQVLALGMVKRAVGAGDEVRLGGPQGPLGRVAELR